MNKGDAQLGGKLHKMYSGSEPSQNVKLGGRPHKITIGWAPHTMYNWGGTLPRCTMEGTFTNVQLGAPHKMYNEERRDPQKWDPLPNCTWINVHQFNVQLGYTHSPGIIVSGCDLPTINMLKTLYNKRYKLHITEADNCKRQQHRNVRIGNDYLAIINDLEGVISTPR